MDRPPERWLPRSEQIAGPSNRMTYPPNGGMGAIWTPPGTEAKPGAMPGYEAHRPPSRRRPRFP